jgi:shikimate kinase
MLVIIMGPKHSGKTSAGKALARLWAGAANDPSHSARSPSEGAVFIDLDELVERRSGKSPRQLYKEGPDRFRKAEAEALKSLLEDVELPRDDGWWRPGDSPRDDGRWRPDDFPKEPLRPGDSLRGGGQAKAIIVATGGGIADNPEALDLLKKTKSAYGEAAQAAGHTVCSVYIDIPTETAWERIRDAAGKTGELPPFLNTSNPQETHRLLHERRGSIYRELAEVTVKAENTPEETAAKILRFLLEK